MLAYSGTYVNLENGSFISMYTGQFKQFDILNSDLIPPFFFNSCTVKPKT